MKPLFKINLSVLAASMAINAFGGINGAGTPGYYTRGKLMFADKNYIGSYDQLKQASRSRLLSDAERCELQRLDALSALKMGQLDEARKLITQWLSDWGASPRRTDMRMYLADTYFAENPAEALRIYDTIQPDALSGARANELYYRTGYCALRLAEFDRARAAYGRLTASPEYGSAAKFYLGYIAYAQGNYTEAKALFGQSDNRTMPGAMADYYLAQIYYHEGDYARAVTTARALIANKNVEPQFTLEANRIAGESLYLSNRPDQAIAYLRTYVNGTDKPLISALYILGLSEYADGEYSAAVKSLRPVTAENSAMAQNAYLYIGQALVKQGDVDGAIMAFDRALHMDYDASAREAAYYNYAVAKYAGGSVPFGSSVQIFRQFLQQYPESKFAANVNRYIITGYIADNDFSQALAAINDVRYPDESTLKAKQYVLYTLGARALNAGRSAEAVNLLKQARTLAKYNDTVAREVNLSLGEALLREGNYSQAVTELNAYNSGRVTENTPIAYYDLGYAYMGLRDYPSAARAFSNVIGSHARTSEQMLADTYNRLGDCLYYQKEWTDAAEAYSKAYSTQPASGDYPLFQQAVMLGYANDYAGKLEGMKRLIDEFPTSSLIPDALLEMTEAQLQTDNREAALATCQRLIDTYPGTSQGRQAYLQKALTQASIGNNREAMNTYRELIAAYPGSDEALQAAEAYKHLCTEAGTLDEYVSFMNSIENAPAVNPAEIDRLAFESAEEFFVDGKGTKRLEDYVNSHNDGAYALQAYSYLMEDADDSGDSRKAYRYACIVTDRWPDNAAAESAYAIRGDYEYSVGDSEEALNSWKKLEARASTPAMTNEARMGIMRVARDLGRPDDLLAAAEAVLSSSAIGTEDKLEASFSKALAYSLKDDRLEAEEIWQTLAGQTEMLYGAKSAVYLAESQLEGGDKTKALNTARALVDSGTPYSYWLARGFIVLSDALRAQGKEYEANEYLNAWRENSPGSESDIFQAIEQRLNK